MRMQLMSKFVNLHNSYFGLGSLPNLIWRWARPYRHQGRASLNDREIRVEWTESAQEALVSRSQPLNIEMQLYFSCVVKKRIIFDAVIEADSVSVNDRINICFRSVQSAVCSPEVFARDYPEARELNATSAKMTPSRLRFDYKAGQWVGEFGYA